MVQKPVVPSLGLLYGLSGPDSAVLVCWQRCTGRSMEGLKQTNQSELHITVLLWGVTGAAAARTGRTGSHTEHRTVACRANQTFLKEDNRSNSSYIFCVLQAVD